jgi:hypothetical protein
MERKWQETPLSKLFMLADEFVALRQRAQSIFINEALKRQKLTLWEAFTAIDADNNGVLTPAEFYGALIWLGVPGLCVGDVVDFIESMDRNRDGLIDYKEYMGLLAQDSSDNDLADVEEVMKNEDASNLENMAPVIMKVKPYGAEEIRDMLIKRKQEEMIRQRDERIHKQKYQEELDVRIFEEELEESKKRPGGANPVVCLDNRMSLAYATKFGTTQPLSKDTHGDPNQSAPIMPELDNSFKDEDPWFRRLTDFRFSMNQLPIRCVVTGKSLFLPIHTGTLGEKPIRAMQCKKRHELRAEWYSAYYRCNICKLNGGSVMCTLCYFSVCRGCFDGDRRGKEADRRDPKKHPTFLRCVSSANFVVQIPAVGGANKRTGEYTITMEVRFSKLPPHNNVQSLMRFTTPDLTQTKRIHRASVFLNSDGWVIAKPTLVGGGGVDDRRGRIVANKWCEVSMVVKPTDRTMRTFINGVLCSESFDLDSEDLHLQHRIIVFGGGKQAQARGGDIRRLQIIGAALNDEEIMRNFVVLANDNPGLGPRIARVQACYRGYHYRYAEMFARRVGYLTEKFMGSGSRRLKLLVKAQALFRGFHVRLPTVKAKAAVAKAAKEAAEAEAKRLEQQEIDRLKAVREREEDELRRADQLAKEEEKHAAEARLRVQQEEIERNHKENRKISERAAQIRGLNSSSSRNMLVNRLEESKEEAVPPIHSKADGGDARQERKDKFAALKARKEKEKLEKQQQGALQAHGDPAEVANTASAEEPKATPKRVELQTTVLNGHTDSVVCVQFNSSYDRVLSGSDDKSVLVWNASHQDADHDGSPILNLKGCHDGGVYAIASNGGLVCTGSEDKTVRVWQFNSSDSREEINNGTHCELIITYADWIYSLALNSSGGLLASGSEDSIIRLYDLTSRTDGKVLVGHTDSIRCVNFSADGSRLVSASADNLIKVWDVVLGTEVSTLTGHTDWAFSACFVPTTSSSARVVSGSLDKTVRIWDADNAVCLSVFLGHTGAVYSVCVSGDGLRVVSGSADKTIKVWDTVSGSCLRDLTGHVDCVFSVAVNLSGDIIASGSYDRTVRIWRLPE